MATARRPVVSATVMEITWRLRILFTYTPVVMVARMAATVFSFREPISSGSSYAS